MIFRQAQPEDYRRIAQLHAESWQSAYRGILPDHWLDHGVYANRLARWENRMLNGIAADMLILTASEGDQLAGFICVQLDEDGRWGALVDNLHVHPQRKGQGLGRSLMSHGASWIGRQRPGSPVHLWAFEANQGARAFYRRLGGAEVERKVLPAPDGSQLPEIRYAWERADILLAKAGPAGSG